MVYISFVLSDDIMELPQTIIIVNDYLLNMKCFFHGMLFVSVKSDFRCFVFCFAYIVDSV